MGTDLGLLIERALESSNAYYGSNNHLRERIV